MQDKLESAFKRRDVLRWIMAGVLLLIFIGLRLINLQTTVLSSDDILTVPAFTFVPWQQLPTVIYERLTQITGPIFPTVVDGILVNMFGTSILALRLHSVIVSILGLFILWRILTQLFPTDRWAQGLPCVLYTFSIPAIIYAQQIQPTTYYFFATGLQLTVFIPFYRTRYSDPAFRRRMVIFVAVSTLAFFLNYISILVTTILGAIWCFQLYESVRRKRLKLQDGMRFFISFAVLHLILLLLILNIPYEGYPSRSYFIPYYFLNPIEFMQHSYDLITYHLNYVFDLALYRPFGFNILSLPFVVLVLVGLVRFIRAGRLHIIYAAFTLLTLYAASQATLYPYGGLRHSFTFAPFLYGLIGYAVASFRQRWRDMLLSGFVIYMLVCWLLSGVDVYEMRRSRLDSAVIARFVAEYNVSLVVAHSDMYEVLILQDSPLLDSVSLVQLPDTDDLGSLNLEEPFLLVAYRTAIDPTWINALGTLPAHILYNPQDFTIATLVADMGLLPAESPGTQSIYGPMNGFFLYYVEPER
jgi:hypothetical protein